MKVRTPRFTCCDTLTARSRARRCKSGRSHKDQRLRRRAGGERGLDGNSRREGEGSITKKKERKKETYR